MRELPILFTGPMVRAILDGRKTQTRRVIKPQPALHPWTNAAYAVKTEWLYANVEPRDQRYGFWANPLTDEAIECPYGGPSDLLWVRETWRLIGVAAAFTSKQIRQSGKFLSDEVAYAADEGAPEQYTWRPSIFMPRWASRLTLEVTDVRVQRVQEIREEDAKAEGVVPENVPHLKDIAERAGMVYAPQKLAFSELWDSINAKRGYGWDSNPWVFAITFRRVTP